MWPMPLWEGLGCNTGGITRPECTESAAIGDARMTRLRLGQPTVPYNSTDDPV